MLNFIFYAILILILFVSLTLSISIGVSVGLMVFYDRYKEKNQCNVGTSEN